MWRNLSLMYPAVVLLLAAILSTMAVGYIINYAILKDVLQDQVETRAELVTRNIQNNLTLKIDHVIRYKEEWLANMDWLTNVPEATIGTSPNAVHSLDENWNKLSHFFPYTDLDFLLVVDSSGRITHHLPRLFQVKGALPRNVLEQALEETAQGKTWFTIGEMAGHWSIQIFAPLRTAGSGSRMVVFGYQLSKIANQIKVENPQYRFLLAAKNKVISSDPVVKQNSVDEASIHTAIRKNRALIAFDDRLDWNLYYTPVKIFDETLALIIPVNLETSRQALSESRNRLFLSIVFIVLLLLVLATVMNILILSPLRRLHGKASALVAACSSPGEMEPAPSPGQRGNEISMLDQSLQSASKKLYAHQQRLREDTSLLEGLALRDPLTGFLNQQMFVELLDRELLKCRRKSRKLAVLVMGLDRMSPAMETLTAKTAGLLLQEVAGRLRRDVRGEDLLFRTAEREFCAFVPECPNTQSVIQIARRIEQSLTQAYDAEGIKFRLGINIGISLFPEQADEVKDLIEMACIASLVAKEDENGHCRVYDAASG